LGKLPQYKNRKNINRAVEVCVYTKHLTANPFIGFQTEITQNEREDIGPN
jgi:hypothetical protein